MEAKEFPTSAALSIATGFLFGSFDDMHELAEWLLGHPVWTHELADRALWERLREAAFRQQPQLRNLPEFVPGDNAGAAADAYELAYRATTGSNALVFVRGSEERTESPIASLQRMLDKRGGEAEGG